MECSDKSFLSYLKCPSVSIFGRSPNCPNRKLLEFLIVNLVEIRTCVSIKCVAVHIYFVGVQFPIQIYLAIAFMNSVNATLYSVDMQFSDFNFNLLGNVSWG